MPGWALAKSLSEAPLVWFMEGVAKLMQEETPHDHDQNTQWAVLCVKMLAHKLAPVKCSHTTYRDD